MNLADRYEELQGVATPRTVPALDAAEVFLRDGGWHFEVKLVNIMVAHSTLLPGTAAGVLRNLARKGTLQIEYEKKVTRRLGKYRTVRRNVRYRLTPN